jgi:hypothetical protein
MDRFFTIASVNGSKKIRGGGRHKGSTPMMVAKKVADKLCNENKMKNKIMFSIRETTKDSKKKTYHYTAIRKKDKLKVAVNKSFVGGVPFPEIFKLKNNNMYLSLDSSGNHYIYVSEENKGTNFIAVEDPVNKGIYAIKQDILTGKSIYYDIEGKVYKPAINNDLIYEFTRVPFHEPGRLYNIVSKNYFEIVPVRYFYLKNKQGKYLTVTYPGNTVETPTKTDYTITWTDNPNTIWYIYEKEQKEEYSVYMKDADAWYTTFDRKKKSAISLVYNINEWTLGDAMSSVKLVIQGPIVQGPIEQHPFNEEHKLTILDISHPPFHLTRS